MPEPVKTEETVTEPKKSFDRPVFSIKEAQDLSNRTAKKVVDSILKFLGNNEEEAPKLSKENEALMTTHQATDEEKEEVREQLKSTPDTLQAQWLGAFYEARANQHKDPNGHAWTVVKCSHKKIGEEWKPFTVGANIEGAKDSESTTVYHPKLAQPIKCSSRKDAVQFAITLVANEMPEVKYDEEKQVFEISKGEDKPVEAKSAEEAQGIVEKSLTDSGQDESSAKEYSEALMEKVQAKLKETTSMKVEAESKQVTPSKPNKPLVSGVGVPTDKVSQPKGGHPVVPGYVSTETAPKTIEPAKKDKNALKQQHSGDYSSLAKASDSEIKKLQGKKGLMTEVAKLASTEEGAQALQNLVDEHKKTEETPVEKKTQ